MDSEEEIEKEPSNAVEKIRRLLFNYDLELTASQGELSLNQAKIQRYADKKNKAELERYTTALIDVTKVKVYIEHLTKGKNETYKCLESLLETYTPRYKAIWLMYFISKLSYEEIAEKAHYSYDGVRKIIKRLKCDLIDYGLWKDDEETE